MNILIATPEAVPYAKTGGLADVAGALAKELSGLRIPVRLVMPFYREVMDKLKGAEDLGRSIHVPVGGKTYTGRLYGHESAVFIRCDGFFDRPELYGTPEGDYPDNAERYVFFSRGVLEAARALRFRPDVIHAHDWQSALIPLYIKTLYRNDEYFKATKTVFTIHNLGYQGLFPGESLPVTGLPPDVFNPEGIEFYGMLNFLKGGIAGADAITTVSPTYAKEILTPGQGFGLEGFLAKRARALSGIINGIDYALWDPVRDPHIPENYSAKDPAGKNACKKALLRRCSFVNPAAPVAAFVGRLSAQKGLEILVSAAGDMLKEGLNLVFLGKGDESYQGAIKKLALAHGGSIYAHIGFDEEFSHLIYAGSDLFLMPSLYEPCGLGQMIALRCGSLPLARKTGGLADSIVNYTPLSGRGTGFLFDEPSAYSLMGALRTALCVYADKKRWGKVVGAAMRADFSWRKSVKKYVELYGGLLGEFK